MVCKFRNIIPLFGNRLLSVLFFVPNFAAEKKSTNKNNINMPTSGSLSTGEGGGRGHIKKYGK